MNFFQTLYARILFLGMCLQLFGQHNTYSLTLLAPLQPSDAFAVRINDWQGITGNAFLGGGRHAVRWHAGNVLDIGTLMNSFYSRGLDIAETGDLVGAAFKPGGSQEFPFIYRNGVASFISKTEPGQATGVSNDGGVVGSWYVNFNEEAFYWTQANGFEDLHQLYPYPSVSHLNAINDNLQACGYILPPGSSFPKAYAWLGHSSGWFLQPLADVEGNARSVAYDINDHGVVAGLWGTEAVYWRPSLHIWPATLLGKLGGTYSEAHGINNANQIVGYATVKGRARAFLWDCGTMWDLNTCLVKSTTFVLERALGINDAGEIVGYGRYNYSGRYYAFLLKPNIDLISQ